MDSGLLRIPVSPRSARALAAALIVLISGCATTGEEPAPDPVASVAPASPGAGDGGRNGSPDPRPTRSPASLSVVVGPEGVAGWWDGSRWVRSGGSAPVPAQGGESYAVISLGEGVTRAEGSAPKPGCEIIPGTVTIDVPGLERRHGEPLRTTPIAVSGVEDPVPGRITELPPSRPYVEAARNLLAERGLTVDEPNLTQVVKADLDGNGRDEVLVVAERVSSPGDLIAKPGDYGLAFLRSVVDDEVVTTLLAATVAVDVPERGAPFVEIYGISALADLNGDGRMEVAMASKYYEGAGVTFYELGRDGKAQEILGSGCGA